MCVTLKNVVKYICITHKNVVNLRSRNSLKRDIYGTEKKILR